jgi:ubiquinone/menaquinone biosynthesis C-methylase UbiE
MNTSKKQCGWENVANWYIHLTGKEGHYYHKEIIIPKVLSFLKKNNIKKILDLAAGQGVLERAIPQQVDYCGIDISQALIKEARDKCKSKSHRFIVADVTSEKIPLDDKDFEAVTIILALQDIKDSMALFKNAHRYLKEQGLMIIVMNHPCYRIPRQTSWHINEKNRTQSREINGYMSSFEIPISVNPGKGEHSEQVTYYHHSLSTYSNFLNQAGFHIQSIEEWISDKESTGPKAKMENRARSEIPLFLCLICKKN